MIHRASAYVACVAHRILRPCTGAHRVCILVCAACSTCAANSILCPPARRTDVLARTACGAGNTLCCGVRDTGLCCVLSSTTSEAITAYAIACAGARGSLVFPRRAISAIFASDRYLEPISIRRCQCFVNPDEQAIVSFAKAVRVITIAVDACLISNGRRISLFFHGVVKFHCTPIITSSICTRST